MWVVKCDVNFQSNMAVLDKFVRNGFDHINMPSILLFCCEYVSVRDTRASMRETTPQILLHIQHIPLYGTLPLSAQKQNGYVTLILPTWLVGNGADHCPSVSVPDYVKNDRTLATMAKSPQLEKQTNS